MATQLDVISQLATLLGGSRKTGTADTSALRSVLAQLQQQNTPEGQQAQLQALFQQAAGQIPGLQGAYANAVGARRGGNSAVQGALNKLMSQVTLAGQANQTANLNAQAQAAGALANATRGITTGTNLGGAAKNLLLLQGLSKGRKLLGDAEFSVDGIMSSLGFGPTASTANGPNITGLTGTGDSSLGGDFLQGNGMNFNSAPGASLDLGSLLGGDSLDLGFDVGSISSGNAAGADIGSGGLMDDLFEFGVFADGGLVGRDGQAPKGGDEEMAEERAQARFDPGFTDNVALDLLRNLMPAFADGGAVDVYAPGARRSNAQSVNPTAPTRMNATNMAAAPSAPSNSVSLGDLLGGSGSLGLTTSNIADPTNGAFANSLRDALGPLSQANTVSGRLGGPSIPALGGIASLVSAETNDQALRAAGVLGITALFGPAIGLLAGAALPSANLSERQAVNALNATNPAVDYNADLPTDADIDVTNMTPSDFGGAGGNTGGFGVNNDAGSSGFGGDSVGGFGGTQFAADGGKIKGPGTGVSDSIPAMLSNGEYVISKDVVDAVGVEFFDALQASLHTPAAVQRSR